MADNSAGDFRVVNGVTMVPGTTVLVDVERRMSVKLQNNGKSDIVLVPQPTNDPADPLTWSRLRKEYHFWLLWFWGFIAAVSVNWGGPVWTQLTIDFRTSYNQLNVSAALCFLFLGIGCVLLQPTAMKIGRRPVYIIGTLFNFAGCVWGGVVGNVQQYFGVNILTGFGAAPVDSLVEISTTDIFFLHERGTRLSLYIFAIYAGSYLGPVASGYIAVAQGWRWCFWYLSIFFGLLLIAQLLSLEESTFRRPAADVTSPEGEIDDSNTSSQTNLANDEVSKTAGEVSKTQSLVLSNNSSNNDQTTTPPKPNFLARLKLWNTSQNDPRPFYVILLQPFTLVTYPAIMWAGIVYGVQIMWLSLLASTQSLIFAAPPYNFSIEAVGDTNFAAFIGGILGMLWGGMVSDWATQFLARRNKGIMEPEFRLWTMVIPALINTMGLLMYGVGAAKGAHWIVSAGFGTAFIGFGIGSGGAIAITYAIDCYPEIASESLVLMLFVRNLLGTGFTFAIQPWLEASGLQNTSVTMAVMCLVFNMSFLIFTWKGKAMRVWTAARYLEAARHMKDSLAINGKRGDFV